MFIKFIVGLLVVLSVIGIHYSQNQLLIEEERMKPLMVEQLKPINPKLIQPFLFGHGAFYADVFWIDTIQKSVDHEVPNMFEYIYKMVDLVTDLDPRFSQVYIWSSSALEFANSKNYTRKEKVEKGNEMLLKGWNYIQQDAKGWNYYPRYWMIAQLLAYNYGFELKDKEKALEYTKILMFVPDLPSHMKTWAAGLYRKSNDSKEKSKGISFLENLLAVETLQAQIRMVDDKKVKEKLQGKLLAFYKQMKTDDYGYQRMMEIQERVRILVDTWKTNYFYLPFQFYTLIHNWDRENDSISSDGMYGIFFPQLSRSI